MLANSKSAARTAFFLEDKTTLHFPFPPPELWLQVSRVWDGFRGQDASWHQNHVPIVLTMLAYGENSCPPVREHHQHNWGSVLGLGFSQRREGVNARKLIQF